MTPSRPTGPTGPGIDVASLMEGPRRPRSMTVDFGVPVVAANVTSKLQAGYTKGISAPAAQ